MIAHIHLSTTHTISVNLAQPINISIPLMHGANRAKAWYVNDIEISPVIANGFVGSVRLGGNVNFNNITFNPHGNGTHTECVGHISTKLYSINDVLTHTHCLAQLVSITPKLLPNGDTVITGQQLHTALQSNANANVTALVLRTLPNAENKLHFNYSNNNATYLTEDCVAVLHHFNIQHLLLDLPSVDKEVDNGVLAVHHGFWNYPAAPNNNTITEMIYVPNEVEDGIYFLNIMIAPFHNDATPSKPTLFKLIQ